METLLNAEYSDCKNSSLVTRDSYVADMLNGIRQIQTLKRLISELQQGKIKCSDLTNTLNALFKKTFFYFAAIWSMVFLVYRTRANQRKVVLL